MASNKRILLLVILFPFFAFANENKYIIYFKDKPFDSQLKNKFTPKAIAFRTKMNIPFDFRDDAVNANYIQNLQQLGCKILNQSNWLNAAMVSMNVDILSQIKSLQFISDIIPIHKTNTNGITAITIGDTCEAIQIPLTFEDNYTYSFAQEALVNGQYLHEQGFNGEGMDIAICDNGFYNANNNPAFTNIFSTNRILGTYDYVHNDSLVYDEQAGSHGAYCFSFIAGTLSNQYIGTATKSNFYLFHTENNSGERLQEEFNLATALERCSQLGVKVVSISLGYTTFDVPSENHDTSDMMKNDTPAAKAVNIAASKGILVCVAAGNEGTKPWHYISTPSDADSAFAIASVDVNGNPAASSGWGLATDPRVKPNIAAAGQSVNYINTAGNIATGSGTSFATPQIAGLSACLWQAFPAKTNWEIKAAIEQSASQYLTPDKKIGYGIPDFQKAYNILATSTFVSNNFLKDEITIYPNPFADKLTIEFKKNITVNRIKIFDNIGQEVFIQLAPTEFYLQLQNLPKGMYILQIDSDKGNFIKKIIKE